MSKPLRDSMAGVAAFIDECRAVFGAEIINEQIRKGMHGSPTFYACENGIEVGTKMPEAKKFITADKMSIQPGVNFSGTKGQKRKK